MAHPEIEPPTGRHLLDRESRDRLPDLYSGEEQGLDALAQVKFFTPDSSWTWYASEFDGDDTFFGIVGGFEIELGCFSLAELQEVYGPRVLPIKTDLCRTASALQGFGSSPCRCSLTHPPSRRGSDELMY